MDHQVKIESAAIEVLAKSRIDGSVLFLPEGQLDRKLYVKVEAGRHILHRRMSADNILIRKGIEVNGA